MDKVIMQFRFQVVIKQCGLQIGQGEIMYLVLKSFKTKETRTIKGLISEFGPEMKCYKYCRYYVLYV